MKIGLERSETGWVVSGDGFTAVWDDLDFASYSVLHLAAALGTGGLQLGPNVPADTLEQGGHLLETLGAYPRSQKRRPRRAFRTAINQGLDGPSSDGPPPGSPPWTDSGILPPNTMTLGLATLDNDGSIILAIESKGLPGPGLHSKILRLRDTPATRLMVAGGLDHWEYVLSHFCGGSSLHAVCADVVRLLDRCMTQANQAFGLLCGFGANGIPVCHRIDREIDTTATVCKTFQFTTGTVQEIGEPDLARSAKQQAESAIARDHDRCRTLVSAILERLPKEGTPDEQLQHEHTRGPVHVEVLRPTLSNACPETPERV